MRLMLSALLPVLVATLLVGCGGEEPPPAAEAPVAAVPPGKARPTPKGRKSAPPLGRSARY